MPRNSWLGALAVGVVSIGLAAIGPVAKVLDAAGNDDAIVAVPKGNYDEMMLPAKKPGGLSFVSVDVFTNPVADGQEAQLSFGNDTVYVCTRPAGSTSGSRNPCPYPGKEVIRVATSGGRETVYALDTPASEVEGKGASGSGRSEIREELDSATMVLDPKWLEEYFVEINGGS